jgi:hypothetical protein
MLPRKFSRSLAGPAGVVLVGALLVSGCGGDSDSPSSPTPPPSDVAGRYGATWTIQVLRKSDGFQKQFFCYGSMTLTETGTSGSATALGGFATVTSNCAPESYDLKGSIVSGGEIAFTTNGPKPPEGPCPGGKNVEFSGQLTSSGSYRSISARGVSTVTCPEFGEHQLTYLLQASK